MRMFLEPLIFISQLTISFAGELLKIWVALYVLLIYMATPLLQFLLPKLENRWKFFIESSELRTAYLVFLGRVSVRHITSGLVLSITRSSSWRLFNNESELVYSIFNFDVLLVSNLLNLYLLAFFFLLWLLLGSMEGL